MNDFFTEQFKNNPSSDLEHMIQNPGDFQADAVESAKYVLKQRKKGNEDFQEKIPEYLVKSEKELNLLSRLNTSIKSIALYQIISSLLFFPFLLELNYSILSISIIAFFLFLIYLSGLVGGVLVLLKNENGFLISKIYNAFQSVILAAAGISYSSVGLFTIYFQINILSGFNFKFGFDFGSKASVLLYNTNEIVIGINVVALFALSILIKAQDRLKESNLFDNNLLNRKF